MEKLAEYFEKQLNCEEPVGTFTYGYNKPNDNPCPALSMEEIRQQIKRPQGKVLKHVDTSMTRVNLLIKKGNFTGGLGNANIRQNHKEATSKSTVTIKE